jgi:hypothetical protein
MKTHRFDSALSHHKGYGAILEWRAFNEDARRKETPLPNPFTRRPVLNATSISRRDLNKIVLISDVDFAHHEL